MKNKLIPLLITLPLLIGCRYTEEYHNYTGEKIVLDYVEEGALTEITPTELLSFIDNEKSLICLFGLKSCSSCQNVSNSLKAYSEGSHCNTYHIEMSKVESKEDQDKLKKATEGYYQWGEKESYPLVYFFFKGDVAFRCGEEDVTTFITNYVEVASKS